MKAKKVLEVFENLGTDSKKGKRLYKYGEEVVAKLETVKTALANLTNALKRDMPEHSDGTSTVDSLETLLKSVTLADIVDYDGWLNFQQDFLSGLEMGIDEAKLRQLASSSDKAKFKGLNDQIDKLEARKLKIRDELAALVGKDDDGKKSDALRDERTAILNKITKLQDAKKKMQNTFRSLRS